LASNGKSAHLGEVKDAHKRAVSAWQVPRIGRSAQ
jgi:hypothetical protein